MINTADKYDLVKNLSRFLDSLKFSSSEKLDDNLVYTYGEYYEPCPNCDEMGTECTCHQPSHYDRYGRSSSYDDYEPE